MFTEAQKEKRRLKKKRAYYRYKKERNISWILRSLRSRAKRRKKSFCITREELSFFLSQPCFYCGDQSNGLDRIDNSLGYFIENCKASCTACNCSKHEKSEMELISRSTKIALKHQLKPLTDRLNLWLL